MRTEYTEEDFVDSIYEAVYMQSVRDVVQNLIRPPGRKPEKALMEMSEWFLNLPHKDREMAVRVMCEVADSAVFGFLCVLDGVRPITDGFSRQPVVTIVGEGEEVVVSPDKDLHDYFRATVDERDHPREV